MFPQTDRTSSSLSLSHHTITVLHGKAYIFGGRYSKKELAGTNMHVIALPNIDTGDSSDYHCIPAIGADGEEHKKIPPSLYSHNTCAIGDNLYVFGGYTGDGAPNHNIWKFSTTMLLWFPWRRLELPHVSDSSMATHKNNAFHLGTSITGFEFVDPISDAITGKSTGKDDAYWEESPCPEPKPQNPLMTIIDSQICVLATQADRIVRVHMLDLSTGHSRWKSTGMAITTTDEEYNSRYPLARRGAKLLPITTGHGRNYVLLLPGVSIEDETKFINDIWVLQIRSSPDSATIVKDKVRDAISNVTGGKVFEGGSGEFDWRKVEIEAKEEEPGTEGKSLPGPIAYYAADNVDGTAVVIWGGVDPKGETNGDGWILKLK